MKRFVWLAALLFLAGTVGGRASAQETPKVSLVGKDAPELQVKEWMNCDGRTSVADFKGEVLLIEAWKTG